MNTGIFVSLMDISFTIAGFVVGFVIGLTGVGGGSLMTPVLVLVFSIKPSIAVGTDLLYAAITKAGGIFSHQKQGTIDWRVVRLLSTGSIPAALSAVFILKQLAKMGINYEPIITSTLSIALILTSLVILFKSQLQTLGRTEPFQFIRVIHRKLRTPMTILAGVIIGILVTLSSVGAGALGAAFLFFLYPRFSTVRIVGTDLAHAIPITAIAGLGHWHLGSVDFQLLLSLVIGSLPGIYLGSHTGVQLPEKLMRMLLALMLLLIGGRLALV